MNRGCGRDIAGPGEEAKGRMARVLRRKDGVTQHLDSCNIGQRHALKSPRNLTPNRNAGDFGR